MTRIEKIQLLNTAVAKLSDEELDDMLQAAQHASGDYSIYDNLPDWKKAEIDEAVASLDRGEGVPSELVFAELRAKIKVAGV